MDLVAILQGWYREFYWVQVVSQRLCSWRLWLLLLMPPSWEARTPYIVLRTALRPSLRLIFFIILIPAAWRRLHWYFHVVNLHSVGLHGARLARRGAVTYTTHVFASSCMALVRCIIFASLVFWNKFSCRIFQRFECRPVHAMLLQCLLYHNLIY